MLSAYDIMEKKFDQEHIKKAMSRDFSKLGKEKDYDSDDITDEKYELSMMRTK